MKTQDIGHIPDFVAHALWSYDIKKLDLRIHKNLIIKAVLDHGTKEATDWLRRTYTADEIKDVLRNTPQSAWGKKSLNFWSLVFQVGPKKDSRFN